MPKLPIEAEPSATPIIILQVKSFFWQKNLQTQRSRQQADSPLGELQETTRTQRKIKRIIIFFVFVCFVSTLWLGVEYFFCNFNAL
jgi:ABC-type multidrug transport system permease subunit